MHLRVLDDDRLRSAPALLHRLFAEVIPLRQRGTHEERLPRATMTLAPLAEHAALAARAKDALHRRARRGVSHARIHLGGGEGGACGGVSPPETHATTTR